MSLGQIAREVMAWACHVEGRYPGLGSSNAPALVTNDTWQTFLDVRLDAIAPLGCDGMATVHVHAQEILPKGDPNPAANSKVVVLGTYQSGAGGGDFEVDGAHGMFLSLGANTSINLKARLVPAVEGQALVVGSTYRIEAVTKWYTSPGGGPAVLALPARLGVALAGGGGFATDWFKIPRQARTLSAMALDVAAYGTLVAEFATVPLVAAIRYSSLVAPRREMVVQGVEWVRLRSAVATQLFPTFELWI